MEVQVSGLPSSPPSSTGISSLANSTPSLGGQNATSDTVDGSSKSKCLPLPFGTCCATSEPAPTDANTTTTTTMDTPAADDGRDHALRLLSKITKDLDHVKTASDELMKYGNRVSNQIEEESVTLKSLDESVNRSTGSPLVDIKKEILDLNKKVMKLKLQIPSKYKPPHSDSESDPNNGNPRPNESTHGERRDIASKNLENLPDLCKNEMLEHSSAFNDLKKLYDGLSSDKQKLCLLSFSVFPENEIIKKRFMLYWWIGEGFVANEDKANQVFSELIGKGFIEPFSEKRTMKCFVNKCRMHPFVRAAVIILAKRAKFFDFDREGKITASFLFSCRACLLAVNKMKEIDKTKKGSDEGIDDIGMFPFMDKIHMLFNVDQNILDFEKPERFSMMRNINLLCLGRWQTSPRHHIEIEDIKFLEGLRNMKYLKFLSLQGISQIMKLPNSIASLASLTILDLRACPNLEQIPSEIGKLKSLTHLDMSECYLLVNMPKELSNLKELEVLKGFVVGDLKVGDLKEKDTCFLEHLSGMRKLRTLGIYTGREDFPVDSELRDLNRLTALRKLTIEWGGGLQAKAHQNSIEAEATEMKNHSGGKSAGEPAKQENPENAVSQNADNGGNGIENDNSKPETIAGKSMEAEATEPEDRSEGISAGELAKQENPGDGITQNPDNGGNGIEANNSKPEKMGGNSMAAEATEPEHSKEISAGESAKQDNPGDGITQIPYSEGVSSAREAAKQENPGDGITQNPNNGGKSIENNNTVNAAGTTKRRRIFEKLHNLTGAKGALVYAPPELPCELQKLDLQCFPQTYAPDWLMASKLEKLQKLYIRGGTLRDLGQFDWKKCEWKVEILRLKFLNDLDMDWRELGELFPHLDYLEKVRCPKLTFFPCDEQGVWMKNPDKSK